MHALIGILGCLIWLYILHVMKKAGVNFWRFICGSFGLFILMMIYLRPILTQPLAQAVAALAGFFGNITGTFTPYFRFATIFIPTDLGAMTMQIDFECSGILEIMAYVSLLVFFDVYTKQETYTQTEVDNLVAAHISSAYKAAGSSAFASLPIPAVGLLGNVYNVTDAFSATAANFVDYVAGNSFPAGTNVVVVEATPAVEADPENNIEAAPATYKYDVLQGWVDLSNYATIDTATTSANGLMSASDKAKLDGVVPATSAQVQSLVDAIWPAPTPAEPEEP